MKPPMNTEQPSRNQKLGDSLRLRAFVVKAGPNPPRRREDTKNDLKLLYARARMPAVSSSGVSEAVPSLPTTMPAAILERTAASRTVSPATRPDRKSTRLNSSHEWISYAVFCLKKKK